MSPDINLSVDPAGYLATHAGMREPRIGLEACGIISHLEKYRSILAALSADMEMGS